MGYIHFNSEPLISVAQKACWMIKFKWLKNLCHEMVSINANASCCYKKLAKKPRDKNNFVNEGIIPIVCGL